MRCFELLMYPIVIGDQNTPEYIEIKHEKNYFINKNILQKYHLIVDIIDYIIQIKLKL